MKSSGAQRGLRIAPSCELAPIGSVGYLTNFDQLTTRKDVRKATGLRTISVGEFVRPMVDSEFGVHTSCNADVCYVEVL